MKLALCLTILMAAVCLSWAAKDEYKAKVIASLATCTKEHNVNMKEVIEIIKSDKLPESQEHKCVAGCFLDKMGYVTDLALDWGKLKAFNSDRYDTPDLVKKADQVADTCSKVVTGKVPDICALGEPTMKCLMEEAKKIQLPKPEIKLEE